MSEEIRVSRGVPTDEELAAVLGVLLSRPRVAPAQRTATASRWTASSRPGYAYPDGRPTQPGPGAWRASAPAVRGKSSSSTTTRRTTRAMLSEFFGG